VDGALTGLRVSGLRDPRRVMWLAHDERASVRPLRPAGLREPLPAHTRPSGPADHSLATAGEANGRGLGRGPRLELSGLAPPGAPGATRRASGRPSGAARPGRRTDARSAWRPLRELQRAEGAESAAALRPHEPYCRLTSDLAPRGSPIDSTMVEQQSPKTEGPITPRRWATAPKAQVRPRAHPRRCIRRTGGSRRSHRPATTFPARRPSAHGQRVRTSPTLARLWRTRWTPASRSTSSQRSAS
jgi:hypothetical protein